MRQATEGDSGKLHCIMVKVILGLAVRHEDVWKVEVQLHAFWTSTLGGLELSASHRRERAPGTHLMGWMRSTGGLDA